MSSTPLFSSQSSFFLKVIFQLGLIFLFLGLGKYVQDILNLPISAAVTGLFILLIFLISGILKLEWVKVGSDFILGELVLFFIPCLVGLTQYQSLFLDQGWKLFVVIFLGTACVMVFTAFSVYLGFKLEKIIKKILKNKMHSDKNLQEKN
ncbi:CidA/LrgA family protein [Acinetobacter sp. R933-2]|uniref:CidA/LrgA family protein n=1 Tax=Acinetobacter sp. R933-2 TaxID=2746728 RepID=UPI0025782158|nr:CidA/LrgA family protein [Acinetobacter sp. R933-2]MDM1247293.1 CidA/LrgA family protein [Acinetobacter sp. R933-2]